MHGAPVLFVAAIGIPDAWQCLATVAPFLLAAAVWWVISRMDQIIHRLFPSWEWERRLGWLNISIERRADTVWRWMGYTVYTILALALYGIVWGVQSLPMIDRWDDPHVFGELTTRLPVLLVSLGLWLVYLGCELIPKLKRQYEAEELEKFRVWQDEQEREHARPSRLPSSLQKPGMNLPVRNRTGPGQ